MKRIRLDKQQLKRLLASTKGSYIVNDQYFSASLVSKDEPKYPESDYIIANNFNRNSDYNPWIGVKWKDVGFPVIFEDQTISFTHLGDNDHGRDWKIKSAGFFAPYKSPKKEKASKLDIHKLVIVRVEFLSIGQVPQAVSKTVGQALIVSLGRHKYTHITEITSLQEHNGVRLHYNDGACLDVRREDINIYRASSDIAKDLIAEGKAKIIEMEKEDGQ